MKQKVLGAPWQGGKDLPMNGEDEEIGELRHSRSGWSYRAQDRAAEGISSPLFGVGARPVFKVVSGDPSPSS